NQDGVMALDFAPDGKRLVCGGSRVLRLFDTATGKQLDILGAGQTRAVAFAPDGKTLARSSQDTGARLYDPAPLKSLQRVPGQAYAAGRLAYSPDSKTLVTGDGNQRLRLWDVATGKKRREIDAEEAIESVAVSRDGGTLAAGGLGSTIRLWDLATGRRRGAAG